MLCFASYSQDARIGPYIGLVGVCRHQGHNTDEDARSERARNFVAVISGAAGTQRRAFGARVLRFSEDDCETFKETFRLPIFLFPGSASQRFGVPA